MEVREFLLKRDIGYAATFDLKDAELVQKFMNRINIQEYRVQSLYDKFDRFYDDHKPKIYGKPFEPTQMAKSGNKLVNEGLIALAEFQVGKRTRQFNHYVIGEDDTTVSVTDDHLYDEVSGGRVNIPQSGGNFIQRQSTIFYAVFFSKTVVDCTVKETGIVDAMTQTSDRMLLRTILPSPYIKHAKNFDTIFVGHIIYSGSI